jgi:dihydroorotate dehydrogenase (NAD+) catalytic subunit
VTLPRTVAGVRFANPVLLASGTAAYGRELAGVCRLERLGGLVTKAVSLQPRAGNPPPRVAEFRGGMLNAVGLANPGVAEVRRLELPWLAEAVPSLPVLVNVVGFAVGEYAEVIAALDDLPGHAGYEINLSCPNTEHGGIEFGTDPVMARDVIQRCRGATGRPLFAKLAPGLADVVAVARAARDAGADGLSLTNTLPGRLTDDGHPRLGFGSGGVSGPALMPAALLAVQLTADAMPGVPIVATGGVRSAADVHRYLDAGAVLVGIGTAGLADPRLPERVVGRLERDDG